MPWSLCATTREEKTRTPQLERSLHTKMKCPHAATKNPTLPQRRSHVLQTKKNQMQPKKKKEMEEKTDKYIIIAGDFSTPLSVVYRTNTKIISEYTVSNQVPNNLI